MRANVAASVGCVLALTYAGSAFAQNEGAMPRGLSADASLSALYDSNMYRTNSSASGRGSDYRLSPALNVRYDLPVARQGVFVKGRVGYNFYQRNSSYDRGFWDAGGGVNWSLGGRCSGIAEVNYSENQSDFGDLGVSLDNLEKRQYYAFNATCAGPAGLGIVGGVDRIVTDNSSPYRTRGDLREFGYNLGILYRTPLLGDVTLRAMREKRKFPNRYIVTPFGIERDGVKVDRIALSLARPIGARLQGNAGVSYIWSNPDVSVYDKYRGLGWNVGLNYMVGPRLTIGADISQDATSSAAIDSSYQISRIYGLNANYMLSERIRLGAGAMHSRRKFKGEEVNPLYPLPTRGTERTNNYYAEVSYSPATRWGLSLRYMHEKRNAHGSYYDYSGNSVGLTASVRY